MQRVNIIGVPEHFNHPWHLALADGAFEAHGIDLAWQDIPEGTGRMAQLLATGEADMAVILTEGIIKSITAGNPSKIVQLYVSSPLLWGIHVAKKSHFKSVDELKGAKVAISRFGSGSHLMAYVHAQHMGWNTNTLKFEQVHTLNNAVEALQKGGADYFMWEHFTTKPLVDDGTFRRLGDCPTPWPCFVLAANETFLKNHQSVTKHILEIINKYTIEFKAIPSIDRTLANRYGQRLEDIRTWLDSTWWGQDQLSGETLQKVLEKLWQLTLIDKKEATSKYLHR